MTAQVAATSSIGPAVSRGEADLGVTRRAQRTPGTREVLLRRETGGVIVASGHPLARRRLLTVADIAAYPIILHARDANPDHHDAIRDLFADAGLAPRFVRPPMAYDISQSIIRGTDAVGIVGESALAVIPNGTKWLPLREAAAIVTTYLVVPADRLSPIQERLEHAAVAIGEREGWPGAGQR